MPSLVLVSPPKMVTPPKKASAAGPSECLITSFCPQLTIAFLFHPTVVSFFCWKKECWPDLQLLFPLPQSQNKQRPSALNQQPPGAKWRSPACTLINALIRSSPGRNNGSAGDKFPSVHFLHLEVGRGGVEGVWRWSYIKLRHPLCDSPALCFCSAHCCHLANAEPRWRTTTATSVGSLLGKKKQKKQRLNTKEFGSVTAVENLPCSWRRQRMQDPTALTDCDAPLLPAAIVHSTILLWLKEAVWKSCLFSTWTLLLLTPREPPKKSSKPLAGWLCDGGWITSSANYQEGSTSAA